MASIKFVDNTEKEQIIKGTPKVPFNKSKKLSSMDGDKVLYYVETETAFSLDDVQLAGEANSDTTLHSN